jgi:pyruvate dehydrogenase E2 component (dihydrolipoamide acetyltransferase)
MISAVIMPTWGLSMEEGTIVSWSVKEGMETKSGEDLVEIETTKIVNTLESRVPGVLRRQLAHPGETRACGDLIGIIADSAVTDREIDDFIAGFARAPSPALARAGASELQYESVELDTGPIRYLRIGESGPPVVFVHGFGGDLHTWLLNQTAIAGHGYTTYAFDLPGHGASGKKVPTGSVAELAQALDSLIGRLEIGPMHLVAHSLGCAVILALAASRAERIRSLSLIAPFGLGGALNKAYVTEFTAAQRARDVQRCLTLLFVNPKMVTRAMVETVVQYKRLDGVSDALEKLASVALKNDTPVVSETWLKSLSIPIAVICGMEDKIVTAPRLPDEVQIVRLPEAGHMPHIEQAARTNELVLATIAHADSRLGEHS